VGRRSRPTQPKKHPLYFDELAALFAIILTMKAVSKKGDENIAWRKGFLRMIGYKA
jgi:adenosine/AMP kinase